MYSRIWVLGGIRWAAKSPHWPHAGCAEVEMGRMTTLGPLLDLTVGSDLPLELNVDP